MTSRKLLPYWLTIVLFTGIYTLTMLLPDPLLGLHSTKGWISTGRIPLQGHIFTVGLMGILLIINLLETLTSNDDSFLIRLLKTLMTVLLTYAAGAIVFTLLHTRVWNMYYSQQGAPARIFLFTNLMCLMVALTTLNMVKALLEQMISLEKVARFIPAWMHFETEETL